MTGIRIFTVTLLLTVLTTVLGVGQDCSVASDCGGNECCISHGGLKGKRGALGSCRSRSQSGQSCYVENRFASHGVYYKCPCGEGFHCKGLKMIEVPYGEMGVCEKQIQSAPKACSTGSDCEDDECCFSMIRPLGKRQMAMQQCRKLGDAKESCLVANGSGKKTHNSMVQCPCKNGLTCRANGRFDMPLGALGNCE